MTRQEAASGTTARVARPCSKRLANAVIAVETPYQRKLNACCFPVAGSDEIFAMKVRSRSTAVFPLDLRRRLSLNRAGSPRPPRAFFSPGSRRSHLVTGVACVAIAGTAAGCGSSTEHNANGLEKSHITVGILPIPDAAPLAIAQKRGFFKQEGLTVKTEVLQSSSFAVPKLRSGAMDISLDNYTASFMADDQGVAHWHLIADSYQAAKNAFVVMVGPKSSIRTAEDLKGKTIAIPSKFSVGQLMITASLHTRGIDQKDLKWVEMPFPQMPTALAKHQVDAVWTPDPFITAMQKGMGARNVLDTAEPGSTTESFPMAGWGVLDDYAKKHPKTVAAFQRAMGKAQKLAATDRSVVTDILPSYVKGIDAGTAKLITLGAYPTSLNPVRLQRVADLMLQYGFVKKKVDVKPMIVPEAAAK
ncbi:PhnD/SsuA/transferrin family substrate-binding protein [Actinomadura sp. LD22]|uniref:PhnD/SsuA/transferrin family substrate-binding protein n=1 Tax=Actinomadura physcomitrii TaxID=2650748 RepID=A0A6I4MA83_9ACTN|nr:ABC transporter substrate-binding protein [Actinomadura physcomitrii]MWA02662.1 PhnD/SsuA/transferrin family substrate-binding protein [Actinomadura physcomitrii]